jgi:hypothetical protein
MFWPNVGLKYLEFFTRVVSASDTTVAPPYRRATVPSGGEREPAQVVQACELMRVRTGNQVATR